MSSYSATKSGIIGFSKVIAKDLGKYGVTSNTICYDDQNESLAISSNNNLKTNENIASFATYLASDYSAPINGQIFQIEGGKISHFLCLDAIKHFCHHRCHKLLRLMKLTQI